MNTIRNQSAPLPGAQSKTIAGYFRNPSDAEKAITNLSAAGFPKKDIGVAVRESASGKENASSGVSGWTERFRSMFAHKELDEYASENPLDVLDHMGIPADEGRYFKDALRTGGALVTVNANGRTAQALSILKGANGVTSENFRAQQPVAPAPVAPASDKIDKIKDIGEARIQLLGETLRVNKERIQTGSVGIRKEVVTERQNIEVPVTHEEVIIESRPVGEHQAATTDLQEGQQINVPVSEERVSVEKRPEVREELKVSKRQVQDTKKISEDVRHEEARVEKKGDVDDSSIRRKRA